MAETPKLFGIDFGSKYIKICQIDGKSRSDLKIKAMAVEEFNEGVLQDKTPEGVKLIAEKLQNLAKIAKLDTKSCVISIPEDKVFSRLITLPDMPDEKVNEAVYWAMKPVIPVPLEEVNVSFLPVNKVNQGDKAFRNWYAVAVPKSEVKVYEAIIRYAGLNLLAVDTEALANTRTIVANYGTIKGDIIIVDLGANTTSIVLVRDRHVAFTQAVEMGTNTIVQALSGDFGIDANQAFEYLTTYGMDQAAVNGKVFKSVSPTVDSIISEISRTLVYFKDKLGGQAISKIFLTGGGSNMKALPQHIQGKLGVETVKTELFNSISIDANLRTKFVDSNKTSFNIAIGLSLKGKISDG